MHVSSLRKAGLGLDGELHRIAWAACPLSLPPGRRWTDGLDSMRAYKIANGSPEDTRRTRKKKKKKKEARAHKRGATIFICPRMEAVIRLPCYLAFR